MNCEVFYLKELVSLLTQPISMLNSNGIRLKVFVPGNWGALFFLVGSGMVEVSLCGFSVDDGALLWRIAGSGALSESGSFEMYDQIFFSLALLRL